MSKLFLLLCLLSLTSCSYVGKKTDMENEKKPYVMPRNRFPTIMEQFYSYKLPVYRMEIEPKSIAFACTQRNDEELFWCSIDADLKYPDKTLPHVITMLIPSSIAKDDVDFYHSAISRLALSRSPLFLLGIFPSRIEDKEESSILGKYYGIFNSMECLNWYGYFGDCPKASKAIK